MRRLAASALIGVSAVLVGCSPSPGPPADGEAASSVLFPDRRTADGAIIVTPDNFVRAETDLYFGNT